MSFSSAENTLYGDVKILTTFRSQCTENPPFRFLWDTRYKTVYRQTLTLSKCMCVRTSGASELTQFWHFYILKLLFLSIFCRYNRYFLSTNGMLVGLHVPTNFQIYRQTLTLSKCMCMRASELRKCWHFYILKLLFLSIFCRYTADTLSVQMTCLSAYMYRQIS